MRGSPFEGAGGPAIGVVESKWGEEGPCTALWPSTRCQAHGGKKGFWEGVSQVCGVQARVGEEGTSLGKAHWQP